MGNVEILTGVERRCGLSEEEKLSTLQGTAEPDAKNADVARRHDIKPQQIYTWRGTFRAGQAEPLVSFLPVALIAIGTSDEAEQPVPLDKSPAKRAARAMRIEIGCKGGRLLKVEADIVPDV